MDAQLAQMHEFEAAIRRASAMGLTAETLMELAGAGERAKADPTPGSPLAELAAFREELKRAEEGMERIAASTRKRADDL